MRTAASWLALPLVTLGCGTDTVSNAKPTAQPTASAILDCAAPTGVSLDIPGPGQPSPEEAVAPFADGLVPVLISQGARAARVATFSAAGDAVRVFTVTRREDGWWPDGWSQCGTYSPTPAGQEFAPSPTSEVTDG